MTEHETEIPWAESGAATRNLADLVAGHAARTPDRTALVEPGAERRTLTWAELDHHVTAVAAGLASQMVAGQRLGLSGPNSIEFVLAYLGALRAGIVVVPLNPNLTAAGLPKMLEFTGTHVLVTPEDPEIPGVRHLPLTSEGVRALAAAGTDDPVDSPQDPESLAVLLSTAGTSGVPKAAMLSHRALLAHLDQVDRLGFVDADAVLLAALPLFHVFGLNAVLGSWVRAGARMVIMDGFDGLFEVIRNEKVTNLPLAPALLPQIVADERSGYALGTLTTVISGAAPLTEELRDAFTARTGLRIDQGYGLTEAAPGVSATIGGPLLGHGHVGRPLPGVEVRIGDGSDPSEPGEIFVRGANLFSGYWPDGDGGPGPDGWFGTGDIGYLADGELFLGDRARELIMVNGFRVHPAEVEEAIAELDGVESVAVLGRPDPNTGEQVVAFVTGAGLTAEAVQEHCSGRLARFKRPGLVKVLDTLPRGATGKVQKGLLRRSLAELGELRAAADG